MCLNIDMTMAAEWEFSAALTAGVESTDNLFMESSNEQSDTILHIRPEIGLINESDENILRFEAGVQLERYNTVKGADRNDPFVGMYWDHFIQHSRFGVRIRGWDESTGTSELEETGRVNIFGTRRNASIEPYWSGKLGDRNSLSFTGTFLDVTYDGPLDPSTYINYLDSSFLVSWEHLIDSRKTFTLEALSSKYNGDGPGRDYIYGGLTAGVSYQANDQVSFDLAAGEGYVLREEGGRATTRHVNASFNAEREYDSTNLTFSSGLRPSGIGDIRQIDSLTLGYLRELSTRLNFTLDAGVTRSNAVDGLELDRNDYFSFQPGFNYRLLEMLALEGWYRYRESQYDIGSDTRIANSLYIGIRYESKRFCLGNPERCRRQLGIRQE